jgi:hypothetical protein
MLYRCLVQWVGEEVEVVHAEDQVCVAFASTHDEVQSRDLACLSRHNLGDYNYISVSKDGLVLVNVKLTNVGRLNPLGV